MVGTLERMRVLGEGSDAPSNWGGVGLSKEFMALSFIENTWDGTWVSEYRMYLNIK